MISSRTSGEQKFVKRESQSLEKFVPCDNLAECLGNFNLLYPLRLNFNPITAYDRIKSHYQGNKGWKNREIQRFESLQNKMERVNAKEDVKNEIFLSEKKLLKARIVRRTKKMFSIRSKLRKYVRLA